MQCWRTELYGEGLNQWKIVKSEQSEDINDIISDALFNLLNCLRRWLLIMTTGTTVHACWRWFTAHCHLMSSLGLLDDGPPSLANQPAQPPVQPVQPWAKSLVCVTSWHVTWSVLVIFVHVCSYLDFGVAEDLSDFSCIACGIYKMRCCNPTATTYQMRSLEPCIADGFAPVKKAHVSLQWLIHENPNPCRAHPALGLQMLSNVKFAAISMA